MTGESAGWKRGMYLKHLWILWQLNQALNEKHMNRSIWESAELACSGKVLLIKRTGKTRERNEEYEGICTQPNANRVHWKIFYSTKYCHEDIPDTVAFPEQVFIYFPNKDISCKYVNVCLWICLASISIIETWLIFSYCHTKMYWCSIWTSAGVPLIAAEK